MIRDVKLKNELFIFAIAFVLVLFSSNLFAHNWMAPKKAAQQKNPIEISPSSLNNGKEIYTQNCAYCHGENAEGLEPDSTGLKGNTPNLKKRLKNHTDGDFFWKIQNGKGEMPSFKEDLREKEIWNLINYIKSIGK